MKTHYKTFKNGIEIIKKELKTIPNKPGIYKIIGDENKILYVGKAKNLAKRLVFYSQPNRLNSRLSLLVKKTTHIEFEITSTEIEALLLESNLIKKNQPPFNILLKDDKSFSSIYISTKHDYPQISVYRGAKKKEGEYFGPFISKNSILKTVETIQKAFQIRNCSDNIFSTRKRPCLQFQIKRCSAPCVNLISQIEYKKKIKETIDFLSGKTQQIKDEISKKMHLESKKLNFERAALYRNQLQALSTITSFQTINNEQLKDLDVLVLIKKNNIAIVQITIFRSGSNYGSISYFPKINDLDSESSIMKAFISQYYSKYDPPKTILVNIIPNEKKLLENYLMNLSSNRIIIEKPIKGLKSELVKITHKNALENLTRKLYENSSNKKNLANLATFFKLKKTVNKIEIYDNSHIQGKSSVGVLVSFNQEGFIKSEYRKYNFDSLNNSNSQKDLNKVNDDYFMMGEMISRRFSSKNNLILPEVIIIDGGKGHLKIVNEALQKLSIQNVFVISVAKGKNRNHGEEQIYVGNNNKVEIESNSELKFFIQNLRDEAHRFAIGSHRKKRNRNLFQNPLDEINGIGKIRKRNLLNYFGSATAIKKASLNDLLKVPKLNKKTAQLVHDFFNDC